MAYVTFVSDSLLEINFREEAWAYFSLYLAQAEKTIKTMSMTVTYIELSRNEN